MTEFQGKDWFRANIAPYLQEIKNEICTLKYPPIVIEYTPRIVSVETWTTIHVVGEFFTPDIEILCQTGEVSDIKFINGNKLLFRFKTAVSQIHELIFKTSGGETTIKISSNDVSWIDLREGSFTEFTVKNKPGTNITYDSEGLISDGTLWENWYKITSHKWKRKTPKRVSIVMKGNRSTHMVGILGSDHREDYEYQYAEGEVWLYFKKEKLVGFYGTKKNHAIHEDYSIPDNVVINSPYYKYIVEDNAVPGSNYYIYELENLDNLEDTSNLLYSGKISKLFTCNSKILYVGALTAYDKQRMVAFKIEDMS